MVPPRPVLAWIDIMEMASLAEFDLLRDARDDIRKQPWAQRINRRAMNLYFNIKRAHEEIARLNVEIPRLLTFMYDEHADYYHTISRLLMSHPSLAYELSRRWQYRTRVHIHIASCLYQTSRLPGFTGSLKTGQHVDRHSNIVHDLPLPPWASFTENQSDNEEDEDIIPGVHTEHEAVELVDFIDSLDAH